MGISITRPRCLVTCFRIIVPDEGFTVFRALIDATMRAVHEQQQRSVKKKASRGHFFKNDLQQQGKK
jgi:hypothetical protein